MIAGDRPWVLGVIGGSGLYQVEGVRDARWVEVASPWGAPSDAVLHGVLEGVELRFLPRHGRGHRLSPSHLNYRANIDVLKRAGATDVLSMSAVGSLRERLAPGAFVAVDQFIDRTTVRASSFFGEGVVAHVSMADPVCHRLTALAAAAAKDAGAPVQVGGTYLAMEGPQFSTRAESRMYRAWGCDVIGMTNMPEAKLAREAELPYASLAMVTDYDCWRAEDDAAAVEVEHILEVMHANAALAEGDAEAAVLPARCAPPRAQSHRHRVGHRADHPARAPRPGASGEARRGGGARAEGEGLMPEWLRGVLAVAAGFLAMLAAVAATMAVAMALMGVRPDAAPTTAFVGVLIVLSAICGAFGGAVCAWLAGRTNKLAGPVLAVLVAAPGVIGALNTPGPLAWHGWAVTAAGVLGVLGGSLFWVRARRAPPSV